MIKSKQKKVLGTKIFENFILATKKNSLSATVSPEILLYNIHEIFACNGQFIYISYQSIQK